ncbi:LPD7 domain-containing protein [Plesiomonas sp. PI-19]|uniref:LPD7 domain-containing protein n=1 Tax=Plesiomonas sp. PI-19 TaxID=2898798 RepID=UPI001F35680F|nr:hypothetical protein [Plesiomonas sp. PI-19]
MLIRPGGGHSGIKEYLEEGIKNGRDYTRDELDYRVTLAGDLQATHDIIQQIETDSERYLHITLSFKEDTVPHEQMQTITEEFRQFVFHAYEEDEYCFYAEAHLPKIKTLIDKKSGQLVERKPHIHVVIPEVNLRTHQRMDPLGKIDHNTPYLDAFQEVMNEKYGLASPKVNVRGRFTEESTLQYGEVFAGANKTIKQQILADIIKHDIRTPQALQTHLRDQGFQVKERNAGKPNSYINIKLPTSAKGVNLKDNVFQSTFLALPPAEKQQRLVHTQTSHYLEPGQPYKAPEFAHETLAHWYAQRAAEVRFVTRRNREKYRALSPEKQREFLTEKQEAARGVPTPNREPQHHQRDAEQSLRAAGEHLSDAQRNCHSIKSGIRSLTHRRAIRTVRAALQRCEHYQATPRPDTIPARQRCDNPVSQTADTLRQAKSLPEQTISATALLNYVARTHGVQTKKYPITVMSNGQERIMCGRQARDPTAFLTQEMHLSLRETHNLLSRAQHVKARDWEQFTQEWQPNLQQQRKAAWQAQIQHEKAQRTELNQHYRMEKNAIYGDDTLSRAERKAALSIARMNKVLADMAYQENKKNARDRLKEEYPSTPQAQYQRFEQRHQKTEGFIMENNIQGQLVDHGAAPYEFKEENKQSYFIKVKQPNNTVRTVWGTGISQAVKKSQAQRGDNITLSRQNSSAEKKRPHVEWEIHKEAPKHKHTQETTTSHITNKELDEKLQATRVLVHYPKLKELGVSLEHIQRTDKGDKIHYNDKALSVTQLIKETHGYSTKRINEELNSLYTEQERDKARVLAYKNEYMAKHRETISRETQAQTSSSTINEHRITSHDKTKTHAPLPPKEFDDITHKIDPKGNVSYYLNHKEIVVDRGNHVHTCSNEDKAVEIGLRLSIEKFGKTLDVKGSPEYKAQVAEIAARHNLKVEFTDPAMNKMLQEKQVQHNKGMNIIQQAQNQRQNQSQSKESQMQQQPTPQNKPGVTWER